MVHSANSSLQSIAASYLHTEGSHTRELGAKTEPLMAQVCSINEETERAKVYLRNFLSEREIVAIGDSQKLSQLALQLRIATPIIMQKSEQAVEKAINSSTKQLDPQKALLLRAEWANQVAQDVLKDFAKAQVEGGSVQLPRDISVRIVTDEEQNVGIIRIVNELGRGSFGIVHAAKEVGQDREQFALKEAKRKDAVTDIRHEVRNLATIHKNGRRHATVSPAKIVHLSTGRVALRAIRHQGSMDKFSAIAAQRGMSPEKQREVIQSSIVPLLEDLQYYQEIGLPHGDIKPQNLFLGNDDRIMVGDFGGVRSLDRAIKEGDLRQTNTPHYVPRMIADRIEVLEGSLDEIAGKVDSLEKRVNETAVTIEKLVGEKSLTDGQKFILTLRQEKNDTLSKEFISAQKEQKAYQEQIKPEVAALRESMDLFAIGASIIEMMAGEDRDIFNKENPDKQFLEDICNDSILKLELIANGYPEPLVEWALNLINPANIMKGSFEEAIKAYNRLSL